MLSADAGVSTPKEALRPIGSFPERLVQTSIGFAGNELNPLRCRRRRSGWRQVRTEDEFFVLRSRRAVPAASHRELPVVFLRVKAARGQMNLKARRRVV